MHLRLMFFRWGAVHARAVFRLTRALLRTRKHNSFVRIGEWDHPDAVCVLRRGQHSGAG